jgi:hypothetical protein
LTASTFIVRRSMVGEIHRNSDAVKMGNLGHAL